MVHSSSQNRHMKIMKLRLLKGIQGYPSGCHPHKEIRPYWDYPPVNKHSNGKSPFSIGNTSTKGPFSIAMLVYQSVTTIIWLVVELTHLKNMLTSNWIISPKPPPRPSSSQTPQSETPPPYHRCEWHKEDLDWRPNLKSFRLKLGGFIGVWDPPGSCIFRRYNPYLVGGFNPSKEYKSNWKPSPNRGENKKYLKPPPRYVYGFKPFMFHGFSGWLWVVSYVVGWFQANISMYKPTYRGSIMVMSYDPTEARYDSTPKKHTDQTSNLYGCICIRYMFICIEMLLYILMIFKCWHLF